MADFEPQNHSRFQYISQKRRLILVRNYEFFGLNGVETLSEQLDGGTRYREYCCAQQMTANEPRGKHDC
jgi:hypothetical protein